MARPFLSSRLGPALATCLTALAGCAASSEQDGEAVSDTARLSWEPVSAALGDTPNFAQLGNGSAMSVVSRATGRGAKAGALIELFYPRYTADNLWDSYVGLSVGGKKTRWAHDLSLVGQRMIPDTGLVQSDFEGPGYALRIEDVVRPDHDAHLRRVVVTNRSGAALRDVALSFYAYFAIGSYPAGDTLRFDPASSALVQRDDGARTAVALLADQPPTATHCGNVLWPFGSTKDARFAAESGWLSGCKQVQAGLGGVNGAIRLHLGTLPVGASVARTFAIGLGSNDQSAISEAESAIARGFDGAASDDRAKWEAALSRARVPKSLPEEALPVYRRAIVTMLQHQVDNGAFIAAPTLTSPAYRFVWPRDGSKTAVDALEAGYVPEAKRFFEHLETQLLADGSFAVNYYPDGSGPFWNFGPSGNENDQPGMLPWGVAKVHAVTNDGAWLAARYPAVRRVAEHLMAISQGGLVAPSRDLWELETGKSWTYANGSAIAGLEAAATLASALGEATDSARWSSRAAALRGSLSSSLVAPGGAFARGVKNGTTDNRVEIANLALGRGGFGIVPDTDPRLSILGDRVGQTLMTAAGSVRRYEGDRYYGGQAWPVAAAWLAAHHEARGNGAGARALFATMTRQARSTESFMLGEQFDEGNGVWVSAMPLVWSEAAYVRTALALYGE